MHFVISLVLKGFQFFRVIFFSVVAAVFNNSMGRIFTGKNGNFRQLNISWSELDGKWGLSGSYDYFFVPYITNGYGLYRQLGRESKLSIHIRDVPVLRSWLAIRFTKASGLPEMASTTLPCNWVIWAMDERELATQKARSVKVVLGKAMALGLRR